MSEGSDSFWVGIGRGFGGALLFSLPMLMTMEMWWLGFYAGRWRLAVYVLVTIPIVLALSYLAGLREDVDRPQALLDGITAYAIGVLTSIVVLAVMGVLTLEMPWREIAGKIAIQSPTAALGAVLARRLLGGGGEGPEAQRKQHAGYLGEMFLVSAGAFYLASTVAATEEMILVSFKMTAWHAAVLMVLSIALMHALLYSMKFAGAPRVHERTPWWSVLVRYTLPGYVVVLLVCGWMLWTFNRFESSTPHWIAFYTITLALPGAVGGAAGRLII